MTKIKIIPYKTYLKEKARKLRCNSTLSKVLLWNKLKRRQLKGYQFLRQKPLDNYIVDFFCNSLMLAIEIDGDSHVENDKDDMHRQQKIESYGITFLRFSDIEVKRNIDQVVQTIVNKIDDIEKY